MKEALIKIPHKIILSGEFSCIFGYPVLTTTIPYYTVASLSFKENKESQISCSFEGKNTIQFDLRDKPDESIEFELMFRKIAIYLNKQQLLSNYLIKVNYQKNEFISYGLGSSACFIVSIFLIIAFISNLPFNNSNWLNSHQQFLKSLEDYYHGKSSGIDVKTVLSSGMFLYNKEGEDWIAKPLINYQPDFWIILIKSKVPKDTKTAVKALFNLYKNDKETTTAKLKRMGELTASLYEVIKRKDDFKIDELINENHQLLYDLTLSSEYLEQIIKRLKAIGLSGKLTGGGRGGCVISIVSNNYFQKIKETVINTFKNENVIKLFRIRKEDFATVSLEHSISPKL